MQCLNRNDGPLAGAAIVVSSEVCCRLMQAIAGLRIGAKLASLLSPVTLLLARGSMAFAFTFVASGSG